VVDAFNSGSSSFEALFSNLGSASGNYSVTVQLSGVSLFLDCYTAQCVSEIDTSTRTLGRTAIPPPSQSVGVFLFIIIFSVLTSIIVIFVFGIAIFSNKGTVRSDPTPPSEMNTKASLSTNQIPSGEAKATTLTVEMQPIENSRLSMGSGWYNTCGLVFDSVEYIVKIPRPFFSRHPAQLKRILNLEGGAVEPGEFLAIIGPSGAGKSTSSFVCSTYVFSFNVESVRWTSHRREFQNQWSDWCLWS
jgi:ABC-type multidrug transport system fused ATPase/permease subunit